MSTTGFIGFGVAASLVAAAAAPTPASSSRRAKEAPAPAPPDSPSTPSSSRDPFYSGVDSELAAAFKSIRKKDETTKLRGLNDLLALVPSREKWVLADLLGPWAASLSALALHNDRRVRAAALSVQGALAAAGMRKSFAPHLGVILPALALLGSDPTREVCTASTAACAALLDTPTKRLETFSAYAEPLVAGLVRFAVASPEELSDMRTASPEEAAERGGRVRPCALAALEVLVCTLSTTPVREEDAAVGTPMDAQRAYTAAILTALRSSFADARVWKLTASSKVPSVRAGVFRLVSALCAHAPHLCVAAVTPTTAHCFLPAPPLVDAAVHCALTETSSTALPAAWDVLVALSTAFPGMWGHDPVRDPALHSKALLAAAQRVENSFSAAAGGAAESVSDFVAAEVLVPAAPALLDASKALWPPLISLLRHATYGCGERVFGSLLPFLATLPPRLLLASTPAVQQNPGGGGKGKATLAPAAQSVPLPRASIPPLQLVRLLQALLGGLTPRGVAEETLTPSGQVALVTAYAELCAFFVVTAVSSAGAAGLDAAATSAAGALCALPLLVCGVSVVEVRATAEENGDTVGALDLWEGATAAMEDIVSLSGPLTTQVAGESFGKSLQQLSDAAQRRRALPEAMCTVSTLDVLATSISCHGTAAALSRAARYDSGCWNACKPILLALCAASVPVGGTAAPLSSGLAPLASVARVILARALAALAPSATTSSALDGIRLLSELRHRAEQSFFSVGGESELAAVVSACARAVCTASPTPFSKSLLEATLRLALYDIVGRTPDAFEGLIALAVDAPVCSALRSHSIRISTFASIAPVLLCALRACTAAGVSVVAPDSVATAILPVSLKLAATEAGASSGIATDIALELARAGAVSLDALADMLDRTAVAVDAAITRASAVSDESDATSCTVAMGWVSLSSSLLSVIVPHPPAGGTGRDVAILDAPLLRVAVSTWHLAAFTDKRLKPMHATSILSPSSSVSSVAVGHLAQMSWERLPQLLKIEAALACAQAAKEAVSTAQDVITQTFSGSASASASSVAVHSAAALLLALKTLPWLKTVSVATAWVHTGLFDLRHARASMLMVTRLLQLLPAKGGAAELLSGLDPRAALSFTHAFALEWLYALSALAAAAAAAAASSSFVHPECADSRCLSLLSDLQFVVLDEVIPLESSSQRMTASSSHAWAALLTWPSLEPTLEAKGGGSLLIDHHHPSPLLSKENDDIVARIAHTALSAMLGAYADSFSSPPERLSFKTVASVIMGPLSTKVVAAGDGAGALATYALDVTAAGLVLAAGLEGPACSSADILLDAVGIFQRHLSSPTAHVSPIAPLVGGVDDEDCACLNSPLILAFLVPILTKRDASGNSRAFASQWLASSTCVKTLSSLANHVGAHVAALSRDALAATGITNELLIFDRVDTTPLDTCSVSLGDALSRASYLLRAINHAAAAGSFPVRNDELISATLSLRDSAVALVISLEAMVACREVLNARHPPLSSRQDVLNNHTLARPLLSLLAALIPSLLLLQPASHVTSLRPISPLFRRAVWHAAMSFGATAAAADVLPEMRERKDGGWWQIWSSDVSRVLAAAPALDLAFAQQEEGSVEISQGDVVEGGEYILHSPHLNAAVPLTTLPMPPAASLAAVVAICVLRRVAATPLSSKGVTSATLSASRLHWARALHACWARRHVIPVWTDSAHFPAASVTRALAGLVFGPSPSSSALLKNVLLIPSSSPLVMTTAEGGGCAVESALAVASRQLPFSILLRMAQEEGVLGFSSAATNATSSSRGVAAAAAAAAAAPLSPSESALLSALSTIPEALRTFIYTALCTPPPPSPDAAVVMPQARETVVIAATEADAVERTESAPVAQPPSNWVSSSLSWISGLSASSPPSSTPPALADDDASAATAAVPDTPEVPSAAAPICDACAPIHMHDGPYAMLLAALLPPAPPEGVDASTPEETASTIATSPASASLAAAAAAIPEPDSIDDLQVRCPDCTLDNSAFFSNCEACGCEFDDIGDGLFCAPSRNAAAAVSRKSKRAAAAAAAAAAAEGAGDAPRAAPTNLRLEARLGRALLPPAIVSVLEAPGQPLALEEVIQALCNDTGSESASTAAAIATVVAAGANCEGFLCAWLLALTAVGGTASRASAALVDTYLSSRRPLSRDGVAVASIYPAGGMGRALEAVSHLLCHEQALSSEQYSTARLPRTLQLAAAQERHCDVYPLQWLTTNNSHVHASSAVRLPTMPTTLYTAKSAANALGDRLWALSFAFLTSACDSMPTRVSEWWGTSLSRDLHSEVMSLCAQRITPLLFQAQISAVHRALKTPTSSLPGGSRENELARSTRIAPGAALGDLVGLSSPPSLAGALLPAGLTVVPSSRDKTVTVPHAQHLPSLGSLQQSSSAPRLNPQLLRVLHDAKEQIVHAAFVNEDADVKLGIRVILPPGYPLRRAEVAVERREGLTEAQWARIERSMVIAMGGIHTTGGGAAPADAAAAAGGGGSGAEGSASSSAPARCAGHLTSALSLFVDAVSAELDGVEPCPICYAVVAASNRTIPRSSCAHCKARFHAECIFKWFKREGGADEACPMCRQAYRGEKAAAAVAARRARERAAEREREGEWQQWGGGGGGGGGEEEGGGDAFIVRLLARLGLAGMQGE